MNVRGRDVASFVADAKAKLGRDVKLPDGYYIRWGGQFENLARASRRLMVVVPLALALIFAMLYFTFGALKPAILIYLNVPLAATGGVFALALRGLPFSISAAVGFIALFGVAVLNGIVLMTQIRDLEARSELGRRRGPAAGLRAPLPPRADDRPRRVPRASSRWRSRPGRGPRSSGRWPRSSSAVSSPRRS